METLTIELYRDGYTIIQYKWGNEVFWTWHDAQGCGPSVGWKKHRHATNADAIAALEEHLRIESIKQQIWTRVAYEEACAKEWGKDVEQFIRADRHMESIVKYNADTWTGFYAFAVARLAGIRKEQELVPTPRETPAIPTPPYVLCDCGHSCAPMLKMSASFGSSCPDCYDRMSDARN